MDNDVTASSHGLSPALRAQEKSINLTGKRLSVLRVLANYHPTDRAPDHHEIAVACGRKYATADWAHAPLRDLLSAGLVEIAGRRYCGGRTWRITPNGRRALDEPRGLSAAEAPTSAEGVTPISPDPTTGGKG